MIEPFEEIARFTPRSLAAIIEALACFKIEGGGVLVAILTADGLPDLCLELPVTSLDVEALYEGGTELGARLGVTTRAALNALPEWCP